jgi:hypothetical protein
MEVLCTVGFQRMAESRERADRIEADRNTIYSQMVGSRVSYTTVLRENASEQQTWNREEHTWKKEEHLWKENSRQPIVLTKKGSMGWRTY